MWNRPNHDFLNPLSDSRIRPPWYGFEESDNLIVECHMYESHIQTKGNFVPHADKRKFHTSTSLRTPSPIPPLPPLCRHSRDYYCHAFQFSISKHLWKVFTWPYKIVLEKARFGKKKHEETIWKKIRSILPTFCFFDNFFMTSCLRVLLRCD